MKALKNSVLNLQCILKRDFSRRGFWSRSIVSDDIFCDCLIPGKLSKLENRVRLKDSLRCLLHKNKSKV
jgi:hypothetical protein